MAIHVQRTVAGMFQKAGETSFQREHEITNLLRTYEALETLGYPDRALLYRAQALFEQQEEASLDSERVLLGHLIYSNLGYWHQEIEVLRRFCPLNTDECAWTRWHIIDCLSLTGHAHESVAEQGAFFQWSLTAFPPEECFFVIADCTQARSWLTQGRTNDWFNLYEYLSCLASKTAQNRLDRFYCLRTAIQLCLWLDEVPRAEAFLHVLPPLWQEDEHWPERRWIKEEISILHIAIALKQGDVALWRSLAEATTTSLNEWEHHLDATQQTEIERFRSLCHNLAAPLYRRKHYDLAIPLFQKAVQWHTRSYYSYLWLAASLWHTTHNREHVLPLLQQAAVRYEGEGHPWQTFQKLPEFEDIQHDPEFFARTTL